MFCGLVIEIDPRFIVNSQVNISASINRRIYPPCVSEDIENSNWIQFRQPVTRSKEIGIDNSKKKVNYLFKHSSI